MGKLGNIIYDLAKKHKTVNDFIVKSMSSSQNLSGSLEEVAKAGLVSRTLKMMAIRVNGTRSRISKVCDEDTLEEFDKVSTKIVKLLTLKIQKSISTEEQFYNFKLLFTSIWKHVDRDVCTTVKYNTARLAAKIEAQNFEDSNMYLFDSDNLKEIDEIFSL